ncbi:MAG: Ig-like domain-containing protein, partial [Cyclobacteriaceae bacterium]
GESDAAWADYDNDGDQDLLIVGERDYYDAVALLYENMDGTGFTKVQSVPFEGVTDASIAWADYDNDGDQDVAINGLFEGYEFDYETGRINNIYEYRTRLYKNSGNKTFTKVNNVSLIGVRDGDIAWADHNNDGYQDLMIVGFEDIHVARLYQYSGNDTFSEVFGGTFRGMHVSDIAWEDYNQDGFQDVLIVGSDNKARYAKLYRNLQGTGFEEVQETPFIGIYRGEAAWSDYDNDGYPDLAIAGTSSSSNLYITQPIQQNLLFPIHQDSDITINTSFSITFDENVQKGTGDIHIINYQNNTVFESLDINAENVIADGQTVTFTLTNELIGETMYYVLVDEGAFTDILGEGFSGINSKDVWNFTTKPYSIPQLKISSTAVNPTANKVFPVSFTFSESVTGFDVSDIQIENGILYDITTSDSIHFNGQVISNSEGIVSIAVLEGAALSWKNIKSTAGSFQLTYAKNESDQTFGQIQKIFANDTEAHDYFGISASISDDFAIIGASRDNDNGYESGAAYIFKKNGDGVWLQLQKLVPTDGSISDRFANAVSISGNYAIAASPMDDSGSAYIFEKDSEGTWEQVQKLISPVPEDPESSHFGNSVLISGIYAFINSYSSNGKDLYIFQRDNNGVWQHWQTLNSPTKSYSSTFGDALEVYGSSLVIGAWADREAYIFEKNEAGLWEYNQQLVPINSAPSDYGHHVSVIDKTAFVASHGDNTSGRRVYVFELSESGVWEEKQILTQSDESYRNYFASYISFSNDYGIIVNKRNEAAYIYGKNNEGVWEQKQSIYIPEIYPHIGALSTANQHFVLGLLSDNEKGTNAGTAYFYEVEKPAVDLSITATEVLSSNQSVFQTQLSFSEKVVDFELSDINISNGSLSALTTTDSITFVTSISPINPGQVKIHVNKEVVMAKEDSSKFNKASYTVLLYDPTSPTISYGEIIFDTLNASYNLEIVFSKPISSFSKEDITVSNGSVTQMQTSDSIHFYTIIVPESDGEVSLNVPASVAYDNVERENEASDYYSFLHDLTPPTVELVHHYGIVTNHVDMELTITFSEAVSGFEALDVQLDNGTVKGLYTSDSVTFQADVRPIVDGIISVRVPADVTHDRGNNGNIASDQITIHFDSQQPEVVVTGLNQQITNKPIRATIKFSEEVRNFNSDDILIENGSITELSTTDSVIFNLTVTPEEEGLVSITVKEGTAEDQAGNLSIASTPLVTEYDTTAPFVTITSLEDSLTNHTQIPLTFSFSEVVVDFSVDDITVSNAYLDTLTTADSIIFSAHLFPIADGLVDLKIAVNTISDRAGNLNEISEQYRIRSDQTPPTVKISSSKVLFSKTEEILLTISFSEQVEGFTNSSLEVTNGSVQDISNTDSLSFIAKISPESDGSITVKVMEGDVADHAGNVNMASSELILSYDGTLPSASISSSEIDTTYSDSLAIIITFDELVSGFSKESIQTTNASILALTTIDSLIYTATVIPDAIGVFSLLVPANVAIDLSGNGNVVSEKFSLIYEIMEDTLEVAESYSLAITISSENASDHTPYLASLYQVNENQFTLVATKSLSDRMVFTFDELSLGKYTVGVQPSDTAFLPVYLGDQFLLSNAIVMNLESDTTQNITIFRKPLEQEGTATISGTLWQSEEIEGGRVLISDTVYSGEVVANVPVYLLHSETREIVSYTVTDKHGKFTFTGLPVGSYLFSADYRGLSNDIQANIIEVSADFETIKIAVIAGNNVRVAQLESEQQVTAISDSYSLTKVSFYPNPVVEELTIDMSSVWLEGKITVTDMSGKILLTKQIDTVRTIFDLRDLRPGIYLIDAVKNGDRQKFKVEKY